MLPGMLSIKNARFVKSLEIHKGTAGGTNSNLINFQLGFPGVALQTGEDLAASPSFSRAHSFRRCPRPVSQSFRALPLKPASDTLFPPLEDRRLVLYDRLHTECL